MQSFVPSSTPQCPSCGPKVLACDAWRAGGCDSIRPGMLPSMPPDPNDVCRTNFPTAARNCTERQLFLAEPAIRCTTPRIRVSIGILLRVLFLCRRGAPWRRPFGTTCAAPGGCMQHPAARGQWPGINFRLKAWRLDFWFQNCKAQGALDRLQDICAHRTNFQWEGSGSAVLRQLSHVAGYPCAFEALCRTGIEHARLCPEAACNMDFLFSMFHVQNAPLA